MVRSVQRTFVLVGILVAFLDGSLQGDVTQQQFLPQPPADRALVYLLNGDHELVALPFEQGRSSLKLTGPAKETRVGFIEFRGAQAATSLDNDMPRIFLFTSQRAGSHPPFLVLLDTRGNSRRVTAVAQKGLAGYAIASEQIIKPHIRVIAPLGEQVFMEIRPRGSLMAGEYAIIGDDLARIATFRVPTGKP